MIAAAAAHKGRAATSVASTQRLGSFLKITIAASRQALATINAEKVMDTTTVNSACLCSDGDIGEERRLVASHTACPVNQTIPARQVRASVRTATIGIMPTPTVSSQYGSGAIPRNPSPADRSSCSAVTSIELPLCSRCLAPDPHLAGARSPVFRFGSAQFEKAGPAFVLADKA